MIVSDTAVKQRVSVLVFAILILIVGTYCYTILPRESAPDITIPHVFISTGYRGVSSSDIETSITIPLEKKLKGLDGVKKIKSVSSEGLSAIDIEFTTKVKINDALAKVKDKVDAAKNELPKDLQHDPSVFEVNFSELPIVIYSLSGNCGKRCLKELADNLKDDIETIPGVLEVNITGGLEREIRIEPIPDKLAYYGIPIASLQSAVSNENSNTSGGIIRLGDGRYQLRVPAEMKTPEEFFNLVVGTHNGSPIYLREVANVLDGFKDETSRSRLNGNSAVNIMIKKRSGENIIKICDRVDELIKEKQKTWPKGTNITKMMDLAKQIRLMVEDLENNILTGLILVVCVILFVMGARNSVQVSLAIPFSMMLSFIVLHMMGITLNMVVLFSLTLALGMVVDDAIVVVENTYRFMEQGVNRVEAAKRATSEVSIAVINSTVTTLAAFFPLIYWPGIMGEFMKYLPITCIITLTSSLFVAMVINPALSCFFMKLKDPDILHAREDSAFHDLADGDRPAEAKGFILKPYTWLLRRALAHRFVVIFSSFSILIIFFFMWLLRVGLDRPIEFFPKIDPESMYVNLEVPEGADIDYIDRILRRIEMLITGVKKEELRADGSELYKKTFIPKKHKLTDGEEVSGPSDMTNIEYIYSKSIVDSTMSSAFDPNSPNHIGIQFIDIEKRPEPSTKTIERIRERLKDIVGAKLTIAEAKHGPPTGAPINIEIAGDDLRILGGIAKKIKAVLQTLPHVMDIKDDYVEGTPSVQVKVDKQKAAIFGLTTSAIGNALKTGYNGQNISTYYESNKDYDITVQLSVKNRKITDVLDELMIPTPAGKLIPLSLISKTEFTGGAGDIVRINNERVVTVKANVDEKKVPGPVAREMAERMLKKFEVPPGYKVRFTGEFESQQEAQDFLSKAFVIALLLIFLVLVLQFNSVVQPFIIMTTVILSLGGAFFGLFVIDSPFGIIMSGVGVIALAGVVVKNGIVMIDYINKLRARGLPLEDAIVAGGATRLRPVFLTAITAILGLVPMALGISYDFHKMSMAWVSESSQWWKNMSSVVIFGLIISTTLTLLVVPVLYSLAESLRTGIETVTAKIKELYWRPYKWFTGEKD